MAEDAPTLRYPMQVRWSSAMEDFCNEHRIYLAHPKRIRGIYTEGEILTLRNRVTVESFGTLAKGNFYSIGAYSYAPSSVPSDIVIGRYCSIAHRFEVLTANHPIERFTTSPVTYLPRWNQHAKEEFGKHWETMPFQEMLPPPVIGNDVWICQQVTIARDIRIGDGAVVLPGAVVRQDVPAYAIVGGVPATTKRMRFTDRQIERLQASSWWRFNYPDLPQDNWTQIDRFLDALDAMIETGRVLPWKPGSWDLGIELRRRSDEYSVTS